jgi:23S rRNA pseudouridine1911/1915/1917 synthase
MNIVITTDNKSKKSLPFDILYEDNHIIVVNKPSGLLTIATNKEKDKTLYHIVREYLISKNKNSKVFIVHRLDKDTSGIVVLAKDEKTKKKLQENWNEYVSLREYVAVVYGKMKKDQDKIIQKLKETKTNLVYVSHNDEGKEAITNYKVIKEYKDYSLVEVLLETGRTHQIRCHMAYINHPLLGDLLYGANNKLINRVALHSYKLSFIHPIFKSEVNLKLDLPSDMKGLV